MNQLEHIETMLYSLHTKPHGILPEYATLLGHKLEKYLDSPMDIPEDMPMTSSMGNNNGIGIIDISGIIMKRVGLPQDILAFFGIVDLDRVNEELSAASEDPNITTILINVNSPGGFLSGVEETAILINEISKTKEVIVYTDTLCASAAYWISSQANTIIASSGADIGSIGVYMTLEDWSEAYKQAGIKVNLIKAGKYKAIGIDSEPLTDEQKAYLQEQVNQTWELFKTTVNNKRTIPPEYMEGQCVSGTLAYSIGMVDGISNCLDDLLDELLKNI